jgi:hypothetical protein
VHQATELASRYFTAWQARDEQALSEILAEDVTFRGPLGTANGRTECIAGLTGMLGIVTAIEVLARVADEHDVITWFNLHTTGAAPAPTANWSHVEDGADHPHPGGVRSPRHHRRDIVSGVALVPSARHGG